MANYDIQIRRYADDNKTVESSVQIACTTIYTLDVDMVEWVRAEIDPRAESITFNGDIGSTQCDNCLDPAHGHHAIDCPKNPRYEP